MTTADLLQMTPNEFLANVETWPAEERERLAQFLAPVAGWAAFMSAYLSLRANPMGAGDQGHAQALRAANRARAATRKALGYQNTAPLR